MSKNKDNAGKDNAGKDNAGKDYEKMSVGKQIEAGLKELIDALKSEQKLENRFRVSRVRKIKNPRTGESIVTRVVTEPKK